MDWAYLSSWFLWIRNGFKYPRRIYEIILKFMEANPIELRVYRLKYEIKQLMLKYTNEGCTDNRSDGPGRELPG